MRPELRALGATLPAPAGLIDRDALDRNIEALAARAQGTPIRVASKSLRTRGALDRILEHPATRGILAFTLPEALWLARLGHDDLVVGYPTADRAALRALADDARARRRIALMIDDPEQLDLLPASNRRIPIRVCVDVDTAYLGVPGLRFGARRSSIRTAEQAAALARTIAARPGVGSSA